MLPPPPPPHASIGPARQVSEGYMRVLPLRQVVTWKSPDQCGHQVVGRALCSCPVTRAGRARYACECVGRGQWAVIPALISLLSTCPPTDTFEVGLSTTDRCYSADDGPHRHVGHTSQVIDCHKLSFSRGFFDCDFKHIHGNH